MKTGGDKMGLLTIEQMTERLQVHPNTLYNWRKKEGMPSIKVGKTIYFREEAVNEWLERKAQKA
jgi:excisionase family DNA binding protein